MLIAAVSLLIVSCSTTETSFLFSGQLRFAVKLDSPLQCKFLYENVTTTIFINGNIIATESRLPELGVVNSWYFQHQKCLYISAEKKKEGIKICVPRTVYSISSEFDPVVRKAIAHSFPLDFTIPVTCKRMNHYLSSKFKLPLEKVFLNLEDETPEIILRSDWSQKS